MPQAFHLLMCPSRWELSLCYWGREFYTIGAGKWARDLNKLPRNYGETVGIKRKYSRTLLICSLTGKKGGCKSLIVFL